MLQADHVAILDQLKVAENSLNQLREELCYANENLGNSNFL